MRDLFSSYTIQIEQGTSYNSPDFVPSSSCNNRLKTSKHNSTINEKRHKTLREDCMKVLCYFNSFDVNSIEHQSHYSALNKHPPQSEETAVED